MNGPRGKNDRLVADVDRVASLEAEGANLAARLAAVEESVAKLLPTLQKVAETADVNAKKINTEFQAIRAEVALVDKKRFDDHTALGKVVTKHAEIINHRGDGSGAVQ